MMLTKRQMSVPAAVGTHYSANLTAFIQISDKEDADSLAKAKPDDFIWAHEAGSLNNDPVWVISFPR